MYKYKYLKKYNLEHVDVRIWEKLGTWRTARKEQRQKQRLEGITGLDFEGELFHDNKDKTLLLCFLSFFLPHSPFLSFGAQGEIMIIRERKSYYCGCSLIM